MSCSDDDPDDAAVTTTTAEVTSTTAGVVFTGDRDSPFCQQLRDVDITEVLGGDQNDPAALATAFQALVDLLVRTAELAPDEIASDVSLVADGMTSLDVALSAVDYDFDALAASGAGEEVLEAINAPVFADAGARLSAYRQQVCEL